MTDIIRRPTPHGVGGLKYERIVFGVIRKQSHPARGGWIEIFSSMPSFWRQSVPPRTGWVD